MSPNEIVSQSVSGAASPVPPSKRKVENVLFCNFAGTPILVLRDTRLVQRVCGPAPFAFCPPVGGVENGTADPFQQKRLPNFCENIKKAMIS